MALSSAVASAGGTVTPADGAVLVRTTVASEVSVASTSAKAIVSLSTRVAPATSGACVTAPSSCSGVAAMTGASFTPVIVTVMACVVGVLPSSTVAV